MDLVGACRAGVRLYVPEYGCTLVDPQCGQYQFAVSRQRQYFYHIHLSLIHERTGDVEGRHWTLQVGCDRKLDALFGQQEKALGLKVPGIGPLVKDLSSF